MENEIKSITYANGKRITEQVVIYSKSEDARTMSELYSRLAMTLQQIESAESSGDRQNILPALYKNRDDIQALLAQQEIFLAGYATTVDDQE